MIDGAHHSLEIKGDIVGSVRVLERVMGEIEKFVG